MADPQVNAPSGEMRMPNLMDGGGFNELVRGRYGYVLYNKNDTYVGRSIQLYGEYAQEETVVFAQTCTPGDVVVEAGANIGTHTMMLSQAVGPTGRVFAFEPQRVVFQTLCANMALNSITNVECFQAAVGAKAGFIRVPDIRYDLAGNFGGVSIDQFDHGAKTPVIVLDDFLEVDRLKLLKVDVEGMEAEALSGASRLVEKHRPVMYVENDRKEKSRNLLELIFSMRYRVFWHLPRLFNPANFAANPKNVFDNCASANMLCLPREFHMNLQGFTEVTSPDELAPGLK